MWSGSESRVKARTVGERAARFEIVWRTSLRFRVQLPSVRLATSGQTGSGDVQRLAFSNRVEKRGVAMVKCGFT